MIVVFMRKTTGTLILVYRQGHVQRNAKRPDVRRAPKELAVDLEGHNNTESHLAFRSKGIWGIYYNKNRKSTQN